MQKDCRPTGGQRMISKDEIRQRIQAKTPAEVMPFVEIMKDVQHPDNFADSDAIRMFYRECELDRLAEYIHTILTELTPSEPSEPYNGYTFFVEDGSVNTDLLEKQGYRLIVYRQGSQLPVILAQPKE